MEYIFPFLVGVVGKIIDEIDDNKININSFYIECLKCINILFFSLSSINDFLFSFSTLIISIFGAGIDNDYWKSFIIISLTLSGLNFIPIDNLPLLILILGIIIISTHIEEISFPEEHSIKKLISRIFGFIILGFILILPFILKKYDILIYTTNIIYINKLILIALGGLFISIFFQIYFIWFS